MDIVLVSVMLNNMEVLPLLRPDSLPFPSFLPSLAFFRAGTFADGKVNLIPRVQSNGEDTSQRWNETMDMAS